MKQITYILITLSLAFLEISAQDSIAYSTTDVQIKVDRGFLSGTYLQPNAIANGAAVLIIAGSGPTDRDGNNPVMKNNSLKMLAEALASKNIASLRYDKRGIANSANAAIPQDSLLFEHLIEDAKSAFNHLKSLGHDTIFIAGHSQGSLIGMLVATANHANGFISIAGPSEPIHQTIMKQMEAQPAMIQDTVKAIFSELEAGRKVEEINPMLQSIFHPSIQGFLMSYMKYNPCIEIGKLTAPILIIQGNTDIQIAEKDAKKLHENATNSTLKIIDGMNHVLKMADIDRTKNIATYSQPNLPLANELMPTIIDFIH